MNWLLGLLNIVPNVLTTVVSGISSYVTHRQELKTLERQAEIEHAKQVVTANIDSDSKQLQLYKESFIMRCLYVYIVLIISLPYALPFLTLRYPIEIKQVQDLTKAIKEIYLSMPEWHYLLFATIVICIIGARTIGADLLKIKRKP